MESSGIVKNNLNTREVESLRNRTLRLLPLPKSVKARPEMDQQLR